MLELGDDDDDFFDFLLNEVKHSESIQRIEIMNRPTPIPITSHTFSPNMFVFFDSSLFRLLVAMACFL